MRTRHQRRRQLGPEEVRRDVRPRVGVPVGLVDRLDVRRQVLDAPERVRHHARQRKRTVLVHVRRAVNAHQRTSPPGERPRVRLGRAAVEVHAARLAEAHADSRIDGVDCPTDLSRELRERIAAGECERLAKRTVLRRRLREERGDLGGRQRLPGPLRERGAVKRTEAAAHLGLPGAVRERVVVLDEDGARTPRLDARGHAGADRGGVAGRERTSALRLRAIAVHYARALLGQVAAQGRHEPPAELDVSKVRKLLPRPGDRLSELREVLGGRSAEALLLPRPDQHEPPEAVLVMQAA